MLPMICGSIVQPSPARQIICVKGVTTTRAVIISICAALATTLGGALADSSAVAQTPAGDVILIKGEAAAENTAARRPLAHGVPVFVDDTVSTETGARVTLQLGRSTTIKLGEKVRIRLDKHMVNAGGAFDLQNGAVLFDRRIGAPKGDTAMRSPYGLLAVRGTKFFAGPSNGAFGVFVIRGRVDVTGGGKTVRLTTGFGSDIAKPGSAPSKPGLWKKPRIKAALQSVE